MICVYAQDCTDFSTNGLGPVEPLSCTVTETLNGEYELTDRKSVPSRRFDTEPATILTPYCLARLPIRPLTSLPS